MDDVTVSVEGHEQVRSELETLRTAGRREMADRLRDVWADAPRRA